MLTVRQALTIAPLDQAKVVGGHEGLERRVRFVNIMEVPDVGKWMKGEEFLVTAGLAFHEDPALFSTILDDLNRVGVSAFGIKLGPYVREMPQELIDSANRLKLPLIELPNVPYMDFMIPIFETLVSKQYSTLKRVEQTHDQLIALALEGEDIPGICRIVEKLVDRPIMIVDKAGNCVCKFPLENQEEENCLPEEWEKPMARYVKEAGLESELMTRHWIRSEMPDGSSLIIVPVKFQGTIENLLVCWEGGNELDEINLRALEHAATVIALQLMKEKAVLENVQQVREELLEDLIWKKDISREIILRRASFCRLNIEDQLAIFVMGIDGFDAYLQARELRDQEQILRLKQEMLQHVRSVLGRHDGNPPLLMLRSEKIIGLIPLDGKKSVKEYRDIFTKIQLYLEKTYGLSVSFGVGRSSPGVDHLKKSYNEAMSAAKVGFFLSGKRQISFFEELGPYSFLCDLKGSQSMRSFYGDLLGKIEEHDRQKAADLLQTLQYYFECDRNLRVTAEKMFLHRNSVIYRLKKIEELTGKDLSSPEDQFELQLALRLGKLIL